MSQESPHALVPETTHDEAAREDYAASLRRFFTEELFPKNKTLMDQVALPAFEAAHGRPPASRREVKDAMEDNFFYRGGSALGRAAQEYVWDVCGEPIERQLGTLIARAKPTNTSTSTLRMNPSLPMPDYLEAVDIHVMPGNFQTEIAEDDVFAGALYDHGVHVFTYGGLGAYNGGYGVSVATYIKERFPDFTPTRILEIGCGTGHTTLPMRDAWPDAEYHAIDIAAPTLRYAFGRADSLGKHIHFSQQDATALDFPDDSFDLVFSVIVHHEMPAAIIEANLRECYRVLKPGGLMLHDGSLTQRHDEPPAKFISSWFSYNINEPYSGDYMGMDFAAACVAAGFAAEDVFSYPAREAVYLKGQLPPPHYRGAFKR
jgi:SAM-dependent methyltransferase